MILMRSFAAIFYRQATGIKLGHMKNALVGHHYVNVSVLIKFLQKTSVFTLIIVSSP